MSRHGGPLSDGGHFRRALRRSRQRSARCSSLESEQRELANLWNPSHDLTHRKSSKVVNQGPPSNPFCWHGFGFVLGSVADLAASYPVKAHCPLLSSTSSEKLDARRGRCYDGVCFSTESTGLLSRSWSFGISSKYGRITGEFEWLKAS